MFAHGDFFALDTELLVTLVVSHVPEPGTLALLGAGLLALVIRGAALRREARGI